MNDQVFLLVNEIVFRIDLLYIGSQGALDQVYYLQFRCTSADGRQDASLSIEMTNFVIDQWRRAGEEIDKEQLLGFGIKVLPNLIPKALDSRDKTIRIMFHRDDNVSKNEGVIYFKVSDTPIRTARNFLFGSEQIANSQIRREILTVCYNKYQMDPHGYVHRSELLRYIPIDETELERNLRYLVEGEFIDGSLPTGGYLQVRITKRGIDVFENPETFNRLFSLTIEQQTVNVGGDIITTTVQGNANKVIVKSQVEDAFNSVRQDLNNLDSRYQNEARDLVDSLEQEVTSDKPDLSKIRTIIVNLSRIPGWMNEYILKHPILAQLIAQYLLENYLSK